MAGWCSQQAGDAAGGWDAEWVRGYSQYEERQRMRDERDNARFAARGQGASAGRRGDPLGYYETLGLEPGCSKQEVQAAFRGLALKVHPDRCACDGG